MSLYIYINTRFEEHPSVFSICSIILHLNCLSHLASPASGLSGCICRLDISCQSVDLRTTVLGWKIGGTGFLSWADVCDCLCIPLSICIIVHMYTHKIFCFIRDAFKFKASTHTNTINHFCQSQL